MTHASTSNPLPQTIAWQGFSIQTPSDWNVTAFTGTPAAGLLTLATLHAPQLEIRWQHHRHPDRARKRIENRKPKIETPTPSSVLSPQHSSSSRLYELTFPTPHPLQADILASFTDHSTQETWPWQLYGTLGTIPRRFTLKRIALHPGHTALTFTHRSLSPALSPALPLPFPSTLSLTLGAYSLADHLLAGASLHTFASTHIPLIKNARSPHWIQDTPQEIFLLTPGSALFRKPLLTFRLQHDPAANLLRYWQSVARPAHADLLRTAGWPEAAAAMLTYNKTLPTPPTPLGAT